MNTRKTLLLFAVLALLAVVYLFDLGRWLELETLKGQRAALAALVDARPLAMAAAYFSVYVVLTALSVPGALVMTLAGGALFGRWPGLLLVSFASSVGATLAMLAARYLLRDWVRTRLGPRLAAIDAGLAREGAAYLFALRLVPLFPFFAVNLAMGLTRLPTRTFYWVSQLGMLPATFVFVNLGTELARLESLRGLLSPTLLAAFALLGALPLLAKRALAALATRRRQARWPRPAGCDYNLVVIGAGSGGLVAAYLAAATRARVALVERERMGGDCLNTGCVPSKALIRSARQAAELARAGDFGLRDAHGEVDFAAVMARVAATVRAIEPHDSIERYTGLGVDCVQGDARIVTPWRVEVDTPEGTRSLSTRQIVIATGARPRVPPIPGLAATAYLTSDTVWALTALPRRLLVLGGGPIGCELAQAFARLGARVSLVERGPRLLAREDPAVSSLIAARFAAEGIEIFCDSEVIGAERVAAGKRLNLQRGSATLAVDGDEILVAVGRVPNLEGLGLEALGIEVDPGQALAVDDYLQTLHPNIHACGDVVGPFQFTHIASHQAWYATVNALFGRFRRFRVDYRVIPRATFTDPEVARVGLNEQEARERGIPCEVTTCALGTVDRAVTDGETEGFVKVLTVPGRDRILGVTIVGAHAAELLPEFVLAMRHGLGLNAILGTIHVYPSFSEAARRVAGEWRRGRVTEGQLRWLAAFHAWQRGATGFASVLAALGALWRDRRRAGSGGTGA